MSGARALLTAVAVAACAGSGCYRYQPTSIGEVEPGTTVRARLSVQEVDRLDTLGVFTSGVGRLVEGIYVGADGGTVLLDVASTPAGQSATSFRQRVPLDQPGILELEVRELDKLRTVGVTLAVAAGLAAVIIASDDGSDPSDGDGPPIDEARTPTGVRLGWSLPLGFPLRR